MTYLISLGAELINSLGLYLYLFFCAIAGPAGLAVTDVVTNWKKGILNKLLAFKILCIGFFLGAQLFITAFLIRYGFPDSFSNNDALNFVATLLMTYFLFFGSILFISLLTLCLKLYK